MNEVQAIGMLIDGTAESLAPIPRSPNLVFDQWHDRAQPASAPNRDQDDLCQGFRRTKEAAIHSGR